MKTLAFILLMTLLTAIALAVPIVLLFWLRKKMKSAPEGTVSHSIWRYLHRPFLNTEKCSHCGKYVGILSGLGNYPDRARFLPKQLQKEDYHICPSCADKVEVTCPDCGKRFPLRAEEDSFVPDGYQCPHCIDAKKLESARIIGDNLLLPLLSSEPGTGNVRGRDYRSTGIDPDWLCEEICGFFGVKGRRAYIVKGKGVDATCIVASDIVVAVRGDPDNLVIRIAPLREYHKMLTSEAAGAAGIAANIAGLGIGTVGLLGTAVAAFLVAGDIARDITEDKLAAFVDERIQTHKTRHRELSDGKSVSELLREIAELRRSGVLTEEEFARKKEELLGRM